MEGCRQDQREVPVTCMAAGYSESVLRNVMKKVHVSIWKARKDAQNSSRVYSMFGLHLFFHPYISKMISPVRISMYF